MACNLSNAPFERRCNVLSLYVLACAIYSHYYFSAHIKTHVLIHFAMVGAVSVAVVTSVMQLAGLELDVRKLKMKTESKTKMMAKARAKAKVKTKIKTKAKTTTLAIDISY